MSTSDVEVVVTGITGRFPESNNVEEFKENLFEGTLLTTENLPWKIDDPDFPKRMGFIKGGEKFDASFFGVLPADADSAGPNRRKILEAAYEALIDAGVRPDEIRGSNCGVYIAANALESTSQTLALNPDIETGGSALSGVPSMMASHVSFWLGITGPSLIMDTGCSASLTALHLAVQDIKSGRCDSALVGASNFISLPYFTQLLAREKFLSPDGICRTFDSHANGFCRSESVAMVFLQRVEHAKRVYCTIVGSGIGEEGFKPNGIRQTYGVEQAKLMAQIYKSIKLDPTEVYYVELHGTGTAAGDYEEADGVDRVLSKGRTSALLVGSVKSQVGHSEAAAGLTGLIKCIIAMEIGWIPPTTSFKSPNNEIHALSEGRLKVTDCPTPLLGDYVAVNSFGLGGSIAHCVLKRNKKEKKMTPPNNEIPWLICASGRTEEAVENICNVAIKRNPDSELVKLLHDIHRCDIANHNFRGFALRSNTSQVQIEVSQLPVEKRPICFLIPGLGSQFPRMGFEFIKKIPAFKETIDKCTEVTFTGTEVNLKKLMCGESSVKIDTLVEAFVSVVAFQIALVDLLGKLGIEPDVIIGQSVGELVCGYVDGCLTLEQTMIAAYCRGLASVLEGNMPKGAMIVVKGKSGTEMKKELPEGIEVACYNGPNACVLSGLKATMEIFCRRLDRLNTKYYPIPWCSDIAFHSSYIEAAGKTYLGDLEKVITHPKCRSSRWISSSLDPEMEENIKWQSDLCSAEYHYRNFTGPVHLETAYKKVPSNAIVIEIAPTSIITSVLEKSDRINIPLLDNKADNYFAHFLQQLGRLYLAGANPDISVLYPDITYPVSRGTAMISPLIKWNYNETWKMPKYTDAKKNGIKVIGTNQLKDIYKIDGKEIYPFSSCLEKVWETLAACHEKETSDLPVEFRNVIFFNLLEVEDFEKNKVIVEVKKVTGYFEVRSDEKLFMTGSVFCTGGWVTPDNIETDSDFSESSSIGSDDFYCEFQRRHFDIGHKYSPVKFIDVSLKRAVVTWKNQWDALIESLIQLQMFGKFTRCVPKLTSVGKLIIDPTKFKALSEGTDIFVARDETCNLVTCKGVEMSSLHFQAFSPRRVFPNPLLEKFVFVPHFKHEGAYFEEAIYLCTHTAIENSSELTLKVLEIRKENQKESLALYFQEATRPILLHTCDVISVSLPLELDIEEASMQVVIFDTDDVVMVSEFLKYLRPGGFVVFYVDAKTRINLPDFLVCVDHIFEGQRITMLRKANKQKTKLTLIDMKDESESFLWLEQVKDIGRKEGKFLLYSSAATSGLIGLAVTILDEFPREKVRFLLSQNRTEGVEELKDYSDLSSVLDLDLVMNIQIDGVWGSYRHLPLQSCQAVAGKDIQMSANDLSRLFSSEMSASENRISVAYYSQRKFCCFAGNSLISEYSGKTSSGKSVMGLLMTPIDADVSSVLPDPFLTWEVPSSWTLQDAAAAPLPYCQALIALHTASDIVAGKHLLISNADTVLGFALLNIAAARGLSVFGLCNHSRTIEFYREVFPKIRERVFGTCDLQVADKINQATDGAGVDVLFLQGSMVTLASSLLRTNGTVVALHDAQVKIDFCNLPRNFFFNVESFCRSEENRKYLHSIMEELLKLPILPPNAAILDRESDEAQDEAVSSPVFCGVAKLNQELATPSVQIFDPEKSYIITGGLGGFGRELLMWMQKRGARNFVLATRRGVVTGYHKYLMDIWSSCRLNVCVTKCDLSTKEGVEEVIQVSQNIAPVGGIFHLVVSLFKTLSTSTARHNLTERQIIDDFDSNEIFWSDPGQFDRMTSGRFLSALLFDEISRKKCPYLRHFVTFSTIVASRGFLGQGAYAYASSRLDRLCELRRSAGFPAVSIQWGAIAKTGSRNYMAHVDIPGTEEQELDSCLKVLDQLLSSDFPVVGSYVPNLALTKKSTPQTAVEAIAEIMGISDISSVSHTASFAELGIDSVLAIQIRNFLGEDFGILLNLADIRRLTFSTLKKISNKD